ncbi:thyrotroph embryonic factor isoform X3 [Balaenoptera acutorostrata]|uniref:Thyrotroph embryonic factor isoform X3 n=1 Tax=Balaenoptera acutorostrata TaxID=9767 RepID=A0ABM3UD33_BALAC|nr:thyrotroph embryonic factor isoform X3 [Balaenoptera acutorostrata]
MSDAGGGKKPLVEPQAGPGPGPGRAAGERGLPGSFPLVLKKLMENPPREARLDKEKGKEKLEEDEAAAASTMAVSASLMPPIWDKTIPYDGESFHLEYMDLDEFLLENGIPASPTHLAQNLLLPVAELEGKESASSSTASPPSSSTAVFQPSETVSSTESSLEKERETPSPIDPNCVEVDVNFNPDPADLVLSSVPGGELFNPRKHKFAEEDLKPQPMIKKAKKVFVPDEQKPCLQTSQSAWKDKRYTDKNRRMTDCGLDLVIRDIWPMAWLRMALRSLVDAVRGHEFEPWSRKIPRATEQLSLCTTTTEPACHTTEARAPKARAPQQEKPLQ